MIQPRDAGFLLYRTLAAWSRPGSTLGTERTTGSSWRRTTITRAPVRRRYEMTMRSMTAAANNSARYQREKKNIWRATRLLGWT